MRVLASGAVWALTILLSFSVVAESNTQHEGWYVGGRINSVSISGDSTDSFNSTSTGSAPGTLGLGLLSIPSSEGEFTLPGVVTLFPTQNTVTTGELKSSYDGDIGFDLFGGYMFENGVRVELERKQTAAEFQLDVFDASGARVARSESDYDVTALMANVWYDFKADDEGRWRPYVGLGIGPSEMELDGDSDEGMAYQFGGGLRWHMTERLALGGSYRYFQVDDGNFEGLEVEGQAQQLLGVDLIYHFFNTRYEVKDADGDGVRDSADRCPNTPRGAIVDANGCPADSDKDGVYDGIDQCPNTPRGAQVDAVGCPKDDDKDGVYNGIDQCPNTPLGVAVAANGCGVNQSTRLEGINFELNSSRLTNKAVGIADQIAATLMASPNFKVELQGHTDSQGDRYYNKELSQRRADTLRAYLIGRGVPYQQMVARGYGEDRPVASNDTEAGRAENRRVVMKVLSRN